MIDRIKGLLDNPEKIAIFLKSYDWKVAFDGLDPTIVIMKCIRLGIRSSVVKVIIDFLNERKMEVTLNKYTSKSYDLIGGGPQGSLIGQLLYIIGSDDVADDVTPEDKYKYIDDLVVLDHVQIEDKLIEYNVFQHVPSDFPTGGRFLPSTTFKSQNINNSIAKWTEENKMVINESKSKHMVITKSNERFSTRISMNENIIERTNKLKRLGVWINSSLTWDKHISEMYKKSYPRLKMLTMLKYVGAPKEDLIEIYSLYIRSFTEYCSTAFHSSLTSQLSNKIEQIQKTSLKVILDVMYVDYPSALEMCGLQTLHERREQRSMSFALKCLKIPTNQDIFPLNPTEDTHLIRDREKIKVNKARTESYRNSTIPYLQRRLNIYFSKAQVRSRKEARTWKGGAERRP